LGRIAALGICRDRRTPTKTSAVRMPMPTAPAPIATVHWRDSAGETSDGTTNAAASQIAHPITTATPPTRFAGYQSSSDWRVLGVLKP